MSTVAALVALFVVLSLLSVGWMWLSDRAKHQIAQKLVTREMQKLADEADAKIKNLPDPMRPVNPQEVQDALRKLRDFGRSPL